MVRPCFLRISHILRPPCIISPMPVMQDSVVYLEGSGFLANPAWLNYHISVREFLPVVLALEIWGSSLGKCSVTLHSDNMAVVQVINKNSSKDSHLMKLMRCLMIVSLKYNKNFVAEHIPGKSNVAADSLSRLQVEEFKQQFPFMDSKPTQVPANLIHL